MTWTLKLSQKAGEPEFHPGLFESTAVLSPDREPVGSVEARQGAGGSWPETWHWSGTGAHASQGG